MTKFARWLLACLPVVLLAACARPERDFESAPPPDPDAASAAADAAPAPADESAPGPAAEPAADSAWDGTDLASLPPVDSLIEPQLSIELGRRALLQAKDELAAQEFSKVAESVDVAKQALGRIKAAEAADGTVLANVTASLARIMPATPAEFDVLISSLVTARGPVLAATPAEPVPAPVDATATMPEPDPETSAEPAPPTGEGHGEAASSGESL